MVQCNAFVSPTSSSSLISHQLDESTHHPKATSSSSLTLTRRLLLSRSISCATSISLFSFPFIASSSSSSKAASITEFVELEDSGGVKSLDLRIGDGATPMVGDQCNAFVSPTSSSSLISHQLDESTHHPKATSSSSLTLTRRLLLSRSISCATSISLFSFPFIASSSSSSKAASITEFVELEDSGGVKSLDLRIGDGAIPMVGDQVSIHYYGRLAAKQGWRFDSTYDHKDETGAPIPFTFILGSSDNVISGITAAIKSMKVGGIRRVIIPPSQGYQNTSQEPLPPNFFDRQRLFTTIFNPTRLANGEGSTLGILIFDIELLSVRHN